MVGEFSVVPGEDVIDVGGVAELGVEGEGIVFRIEGEDLAVCQVLDTFFEFNWGVGRDVPVLGKKFIRCSVV